MRKNGRYKLDRIKIYGEVKKWSTNISQKDFNDIGIALYLFHTTITINLSTNWNPIDLPVIKAGEESTKSTIQNIDKLLPPNSSFRVIYDYYADSDYCVLNNYKTLLSRGVGCKSSNTFKDRYQKTDITLQLHELYGAVISISPHLQKVATFTQQDMQLGVREFFSQLNIGLTLLEQDICQDPDPTEILQLLQFYSARI